jgi:hypothetical protein
MCSHTTSCMCRHTTVCLYTTIYVSSYYYIDYICVLILLYMCHHTYTAVILPGVMPARHQKYIHFFSISTYFIHFFPFASRDAVQKPDAELQEPRAGERTASQFTCFTSTKAPVYEYKSTNTDTCAACRRRRAAS